MIKRQSSPTCFVIMPIGASGSRTRKRSATIYEHVIAPAAKDAGYAPLRADQLPGAGMVMTEIIHHLANDPLVVADLSGANPNVYYELALRHTVRKPVVGVIRAGERLPFDISSLRVVEVDADDPESLDGARERLALVARGARANREGTVSPISVALPNWALSADPDRIPQAWAEFIINAVLEVDYLLSSPSIPLDPCPRCQRAHSLVREVEHMLDGLARSLSIHGPSEMRDHNWKLLRTLKIGAKADLDV